LAADARGEKNVSKHIQTFKLPWL